MLILMLVAAPAVAQPTEPARAARPRGSWGLTSRQVSNYLRDPRTAVLLFLLTAFVFGGGRKLLQGVRARRVVEALESDSPDVAAVEGAAEHGRAALIDLFRLLGTGTTQEIRDAAGRSISRLWVDDDLIAEEEKALVRRGYAVNWTARRKYPLGLRTPIRVGVTYGVPFLVEGGPGVWPSHLEWSHRVTGGQSAALESYSAWTAGPGSAMFTIDPGDFHGNGPFRLVLHAKVRTTGLTETWEFELPQIPTTFEFDPILTIPALLTLPDDARGQAVARAVRLVSPDPSGSEAGSTYLPINADLVLKDPPRLVVSSPLPCDLAHDLAVEIEGVEGRYAAGSVVVAGDADSGSRSERSFPIGSIAGLPDGAVERPGEIRIRAILTANPDLGWAVAEVRSIWPGTVATDWATVSVIRR